MAATRESRSGDETVVAALESLQNPTVQRSDVNARDGAIIPLD